MEAIVGLGIIEAFSYVLFVLYIYTFFKQIRKKKEQSILYCRNFSSGGQNRGINIGSGQNGSLYGYLCAMYRFTDRTFTGDKYKRQQCFLQNESGYELHFLCICGKTGGRCIFL